jgi:hypothetical protein
VERGAGDHHQPPLGALLPARRSAAWHAGIVDCRGAVGLYLVQLQLWSAVAIAEPAHKARLATLVGDQKFIRDAQLLLVWLADLARIDAIAAQHQQTAEGT